MVSKASLKWQISHKFDLQGSNVTESVKHPVFLIDPPNPFASREELEAFGMEARKMLDRHPNHPQWLRKLISIEDALKQSKRNGTT